MAGDYRSSSGTSETTPEPWDPEEDYRLTAVNFALLIFLVCSTVFVFMLLCFKKFLDWVDG